MRRWSEIINAAFLANVDGQAVTWLPYIQQPANLVDESTAWREIKASFRFLGNLYSTFDRRVCIEVGTSLPLKNSPLVEDNREASDFILGRFFINSGIRIRSDVHGDFREIAHHGPSLYALMDGNQRVLYHQLHPQQKITTMRVKLYARVRTYDDASDNQQSSQTGGTSAFISRKSTHRLNKWKTNQRVNSRSSSAAPLLRTGSPCSSLGFCTQ